MHKRLYINALPSFLHSTSASRSVPESAAKEMTKTNLKLFRIMQYTIADESKWPPVTFTGWKNSSITFWALESSEGEQTAGGIKFTLGWIWMPELLLVGGGAWRLGCLLWGPLGDLRSLQVKTIAMASPAKAPADLVSCKQIQESEPLVYSTNRRSKSRWANKKGVGSLGHRVTKKQNWWGWGGRVGQAYSSRETSPFSVQNF